MKETNVIDVTTKTDDAINAIRAEVWMNQVEAGKYIGVTTKKISEMIKKGYFLLSSDKKLISKDSLAEYLENGKRHRLNEYLETLRINSQNEEHRLRMVVKLKGLEEDKAALDEEIKTTEAGLKNLPHSALFEGEAFKKYAGRVWKRTYAVNNIHLVCGELVSPIGIELIYEFTPYNLDDITKEPEAKPKQYRIRQEPSGNLI